MNNHINIPAWGIILGNISIFLMLRWANNGVLTLKITVAAYLISFFWSFIMASMIITMNNKTKE